MVLPVASLLPLSEQSNYWSGQTHGVWITHQLLFVSSLMVYDKRICSRCQRSTMEFNGLCIQKSFAIGNQQRSRRQREAGQSQLHLTISPQRSSREVTTFCSNSSIILRARLRMLMPFPFSELEVLEGIIEINSFWGLALEKHFI